MYYPKVNRGISFTKPGIYSFCLILLVGLIAISTGINALYVFLSAGLGGFIVSGLLSEWAIKHWEIIAVSGAVTDANATFLVSFQVRNGSSWFSIFQMRSHFYKAVPRFQLIAKTPVSLGGAAMVALAPNEAQTLQARLGGLSRGVYRYLHTVQLTTFPFGILEKFKVSRIPTSITVAPAVDQSLRLAITAQFSSSILKQSDPLDFYSHRRHQPSDGLKLIDWRKSAGLPPRLWVTRQFNSPAAEPEFRITLPWHLLLNAPDESGYELLLVRTRTVMSVLDDHGKLYRLDLGSGVVASGCEPCRTVLASLPLFINRHNGPGVSATAVPSSSSHESPIYIGEQALTWDHGASSHAWEARP